MLKGREIRGLAVFVGNSQEEIGRVQDLLVDDKSGRVEGLVIARLGIWQKMAYVRMEYIQFLGKAGIRVPDKKFLQPLPKNKLALSQKGWLGRKIFDAQGQDAGTVADVLVKNGMISGWEISTGLWGDLRQGRDFLPWPSLQNTSQGFISMM
ncbi:MAG: PRC-barrel domain-containing protein [Clostridiales bacterium]|nr:PRC-barrel domain-containing protein [Clostridiales bacterium]